MSPHPRRARGTTRSLADALAVVEAALTSLSEVDLDTESNRELLGAAVDVQGLVKRLSAGNCR